MNSHKVLNLKDIQEEFGISISMLKKLIINKEINVVKIGAKNHIKVCDLLAYIDERTVLKQE